MSGFMISLTQIWLVIGIVLVVAEIMSMTFFLLWPALAAFVIAVITWVFPEFSLIGQIIAFAFLTSILLFPGRKLVLPFMSGNGVSPLNDKMSKLIGQKVIVVSSEGLDARVKIGDSEWSAISDTPVSAGQIVEILRSEGNRLVVAVA